MGAAIVGFMAFMLIVTVVFLAKCCVNRPVRKLTAMEEKRFEVGSDISRNAYVVELLHHD